MALSKEQKTKIIEDFRLHGQDTGSVEVQIAMLTHDIRHLTDHCQKHPKDHSTKRGLLKKVCQRRRFLEYVGEADVAKYKAIIERLGLRK